MPEAPLYALILLLQFTGLGWFALSMERHWRQAGAPHVPGIRRARRLRRAGSIALALSLLLCLALDHASIAALVWVMGLPPCAVLIALLLATRPAWLAPLLGRAPA